MILMFCLFFFPKAFAQAKEQRKKEVEELLNEVSEIEKHIEESKTSIKR